MCARSRLEAGAPRTALRERRSESGAPRVRKSGEKLKHHPTLRRSGVLAIAWLPVASGLNISSRFSQSFTWGELTCCRSRLALACRFYKAPRLSAMTSLNRSPFMHITLPLDHTFEKYPKKIFAMPPHRSAIATTLQPLGYELGDQAPELQPAQCAQNDRYALKREI